MDDYEKRKYRDEVLKEFKDNPYILVVGKKIYFDNQQTSIKICGKADFLSNTFAFHQFFLDPEAFQILSDSYLNVGRFLKRKKNRRIN